MIYVFLAAGFEEMEAMIPLDLLRRAGIEVKTVGIGGKQIVGAHNITVTADLEEKEIDLPSMDGMILPGGMPGTKNLEASPVVQQAIDVCAKYGHLIAAICAAPSILGHKGLLKGQRATCFPGFEQDCEGAQMQSAGVVADGNIITARGAGCAAFFGAAIVEYRRDAAAAQKLLQDIQWNYERYTGI